eukprot:TRINITY_DN311_c0_g1_i1.p1 TRINITY_DN311_c0_g1~~TRINITY_DN311_c0_g1_i1.p1  ORF type:complete len:198 (+),score=46.35 TRINITY_DN311_c0_g1_i1:109-702(+)
MLKEEDKLAKELEALLSKNEATAADIAKRAGIALPSKADLDYMLVVADKQQAVLNGAQALASRISALEGSGSGSVSNGKAPALLKRQTEQLEKIKKLMARVEALERPGGLAAKVEAKQKNVLKGLEALGRRIRRIEGKEDPLEKNVERAQKNVLAKCHALAARISKLEGKRTLLLRHPKFMPEFYLMQKLYRQGSQS